LAIFQIWAHAFWPGWPQTLILRILAFHASGITDMSYHTHLGTSVLQAVILVKIHMILSQGLVAYTCNPSYLGG
jgi:hypothetical protein